MTDCRIFDLSHAKSWVAPDEISLHRLREQRLQRGPGPSSSRAKGQRAAPHGSGLLANRTIASEDASSEASKFNDWGAQPSLCVPKTRVAR
jgi:hypothetical protein